MLCSFLYSKIRCHPYCNHHFSLFRRAAQLFVLSKSQTEEVPVLFLCCRFYFTNGDRIREEDPFAALGLTWGATTNEIKEAFRSKARSLHPDVNTVDTPEESLKKFQYIQKAYQTLMKKGNDPNNGDDDDEQWSFQVWRNGDRIAQDRKDVAGVMRKRPSQPASSLGSKWGIASLGHPDGRGQNSRRAEYLDSGSSIKSVISNSVGTGQNKWVTKKKFQSWDPNTVKVKAVTKPSSSRKTTMTIIKENSKIRKEK